MTERSKCNESIHASFIAIFAENVYNYLLGLAWNKRMSTCPNRKRYTHGHMCAALTPAKDGGIFRTDTRISVSDLNLTIMNLEGENSISSMFSCNHILPGRGIHYKGDNSDAKTRQENFPRGNIYISGGRFHYKAIFSDGKFFYGKIIVIFFGDGGGATTRGKATL